MRCSGRGTARMGLAADLSVGRTFVDEYVRDGHDQGRILL